MIRPIFSFIVIILSLGFAFFYVNDEWTVVQKHRDNIVTLDEVKQKSVTINRLISETRENLKGVPKENLDRFAVFLPESIDDIRFANNLQHVGYLNGIVLDNIKVAEKDKPMLTDDFKSRNTIAANVATAQKGGAAKVATSGDKRYKATKASFSATTSYDTFLAFLDNLEKSLGLINITSLSFAPISSNASDGKKDAGQPLYQFAVELETYSLQ